MSIELTVMMQTAEGALLRVLGTLERRGFQVTELHGQPRGECTELRLSVNGKGRCIEVMMRQLQRIEDVRYVRAGVPQRTSMIKVTPISAPRSRRTLDFFGIPEPRASIVVDHA